MSRDSEKALKDIMNSEKRYIDLSNTPCLDKALQDSISHILDQIIQYKFRTSGKNTRIFYQKQKINDTFYDIWSKIFWMIYIILNIKTLFSILDDYFIPILSQNKRKQIPLKQQINKYIISILRCMILTIFIRFRLKSLYKIKYQHLINEVEQNIKNIFNKYITDMFSHEIVDIDTLWDELLSRELYKYASRRPHDVCKRNLMWKLSKLQSL